MQNNVQKGETVGLFSSSGYHDINVFVKPEDLSVW